jgi:hypothetical protein
MQRHEDAAAAGMEGRHRIEPAAHFTPVERVACQTGWLPILSLHPDAESLASVVRPHHSPIREQVDPFTKKGKLALPVRRCLRAV